MNSKTNPKVAVLKTSPKYPDSFYPPKIFPEFENLNIHKKTDSTNQVFGAIREAFHLLNYDKENFGTPNWNPLSTLIKPGDTVLLKPNMVKHMSTRKETTLTELITHPSIIIAVLDYVLLALKNRGTIIIGDSPIQEAEFDKILDYFKLTDTINHYKTKTNVNFEITDFRRERAINKNFRAIQRIELAGDGRGYSTIDLGEKSTFFEITDQSPNFRVTNYDVEKMTSFHREGHHKYIITNSIIQADLVISLPKIKTHRKSGLSCALKNLIGINGSKDCLPHHRKGSIEEGGDEYKKKSFRKRWISNIEEKRAKSKSNLYCFFLFLIKGFIYLTEKIFPYKEAYKEGSWYGNQTIPRTLVDIFYLVNFASKQGKLTDLKQKRKLLVITDGVISGDGDGPLRPTRKETGVVLVSEDFIASDLIVSSIMGFDFEKIPTFKFSLNSDININGIKSIDDVLIKSNIKEMKTVKELENYFPNLFEPTSGWKDHIEK